MVDFPHTTLDESDVLLGEVQVAALRHLRGVQKSKISTRHETRETVQDVQGQKTAVKTLD